MKEVAEQPRHGRGRGGAAVQGHPEDAKKALFAQMGLAKQRAWYKIYNDYLQNQWPVDKKRQQGSYAWEGPSTDFRTIMTERGPTRVDASGRRPQDHPPTELPNKVQLDNVASKEDFYELFRHWEFTSMLQSGPYTKEEMP